MLQSATLRGVELQLHECLNDGVEAIGGGGGGRLGRESPHRLPLHGDNEVEAPELDDRSRDLGDVMAGHPRPDESDNENAQGPYLVRQLSVFHIITG
jgi:hypothetical protein